MTLKIPTDISQERLVRALQKAGFVVVRQGKKHLLMALKESIVTIPRHKRIKKEH